MLDVNYVRSNLDLVKSKLQARGFPLGSLDRFAELDHERRSIVSRRDDLNAQRNRESQEIGGLMKAGQKDAAAIRREQVRGIGDQIDAAETELAAVEAELNDLLTTVPNLPHDSVPVGANESANVEIRRWGAPPGFDFEPRDHVDIATALGILDLEAASRITGARFSILLGAGARLERALISFCLDLHTKKHGYLEVLPPFVVNDNTLFGTGQLPKFEADLFKLRDERNFYLIPTAEVPLTNMMGGTQILDGDQLPIKMTAYTPCFRSEAGSYGKDTRGLIRQHQFDKVELVKIAKPECSYDELESLTRDAEAVLQALGLAYRTMVLATGDMGATAAKTYDIEVWLPSQNTYREISSCSNCEEYQARRAQIRFRRGPKSKPEFAHTLNGSGLAIGRTWLAIIENYQQEDGSVTVPEALRPYLDGLERIGGAAR
ncbi:MAG TPA: serine--tRNA ligase [Blastocatellia bacterium]|nr:serine--tRNA ligase [Blastocatellia bacterium]